MVVNKFHKVKKSDLNDFDQAKEVNQQQIADNTTKSSSPSLMSQSWSLNRWISHTTFGRDYQSVNLAIYSR